jgi:outer membrane protein assembly factor BamA
MLEILCKDKVMTPWPEKLKWQESFPNADSARSYLAKSFLPQLFREGYLAASVDSIDNEKFLTRAWIFLGDQYSWGELIADSNLVLLGGTSYNKGWIKPGTLLNTVSLQEARENALTLLENNGYPFAEIRIDSSYFVNNSLYGRLRVLRGPLYHIDSLKVEGKIRISKNFLHRYLSIAKGDIYRRSSLNNISKRLSMLGYLKETKPWELDMLGSGSSLTLFLEQQRSSRFNLLAGLMPSNQQIGGKALLTGEAELDLKNGFGTGEELSVLWQQIQVKSPRLRLAFNKPYMFNSQAGFDFKFDLLRKDSSFLNILARVGLQYVKDPANVLKIFFQQNNSNLINLDTNLIRRSQRLPEMLDLRASNIGLEWLVNKTDNFLNPRKGLELGVSFSGGIRKIIRNSSLVQSSLSKLYDNIDLRTTQFRFSTRINKYSRLGRQSTIKTGMQAGWLEGKRLLLNELFQLGGIKTLRGFDEEFLYASRYWIGTLEYRYLMNTASYLYTFADVGRLSRPTPLGTSNANYAGLGFGISLSTAAGQLNLAYAAGKNNNLPFNFREAKLHFGFVSLF